MPAILIFIKKKVIMFKKVRTRIAPSPTGMMHVGTARTAIYCWAVARHNGGEFLLRIEDTDRERSTAEATKVILDAMEWLGLDYDNKDNVVYQTTRLDRYKEVADRLLEKGLAYKCYATKEELDAMRQAQQARGEKPRYDGRWRPENCAGKPIPEGVTPVIRFRTPDEGSVSWNDAVYGPITVNNNELDDLVIMRGDGMPTYNFAVVIDDIDMGISHVIRGADHINNTPRQIHIYKALGAELPIFAHLPLIHDVHGSKFSKRIGSASVMVNEEEGYLPEALFNYLAHLGWAHGDVEKFDKDQLAQWFELKDCSRSPARFDPKKYLWLNHEYIKEADNARLAELLKPRLQARGADLSRPIDLEAVVAFLKDRTETLVKLADEAMLFYRDNPIDPSGLSEMVKDVPTSQKACEVFLERAKIIVWDREEINALIKSIMREMDIKMPHIAIPLRILATGEKHTPSIDVTLELLGRDYVLKRLQKGLEMWKGTTAVC